MLCGSFAIFAAMKTYAEMEILCERAFNDNGPFWHVCTDGSVMSDIFSSDEEMRMGMTVLAVCAALSARAELVTFELMNNHVHFIMRGGKDECLDFFEAFKRRLRRWYQREDRPVDWSRFVAQILSIDSLQSLRNEIVYVNRNAYVANRMYTPFSYPWGGGWAYFSSVIGLLPTVSVREMGARRVREMTHYRDIEEIAGLRFVGDVPFIPSFCRVDLGQSMFRDARHYFHLLTRNAEAFSQIALRLKDAVFLTDEEVFVVASRCAKEMFSAELKMLTPEQKIKLARKLHFEYNASNRLLRRVLGLEMSILEELFP